MWDPTDHILGAPRRSRSAQGGPYFGVPVELTYDERPEAGRLQSYRPYTPAEKGVDDPFRIEVYPWGYDVPAHQSRRHLGQVKNPTYDLRRKAT